MPLKLLRYNFFTTVTTYNDIREGKVIYALSTTFPFKYDADWKLPRPIRNSDIPIDAQGNRVLDSSLVYDYGSFSEKEWLIGLAINNKDVYSPVGSDTNSQKQQYGIISSKIVGNRAYLYIDSSVFQFGIADSPEIQMIRAKADTPWIYLGNIEERKQIAYQTYGVQNALGIGAVPYSLTPSQAMQYSYFIDTSTVSDFVPVILPFISSFFIPHLAGGATGSFTNCVFLGDILDSDGNIKVRSNVSFTLSSIGLTETFLGGALAVNFFNIQNIGRVKTINSRIMDYQTVCYSGNKVFNKTCYYFVLREKNNLSSFYSGLGNFLKIFLNEFSTSTYSVYSLGKSVNSLILDTQDGIKIGDAIVDRSALLQPGSLSISFLMDNILRKKIKSDMDRDFQSHLSSGGNETNFNQNYAIIVLSDDDIQEEQISSTLTMNAEAQSKSVSKSIASVYANIIPDESSKTVSADVSPATYVDLFSWDKNFVYGFQFFQALAKAIKVVFKESSLVEEKEYIDGQVLKEQCARMVAENSSVANYDLDQDGKITLIDRIISFYSSYTPDNDLIQNDGSFFSTKAAEMRYWRKVCPIGQLFSLRGKIISKQEISSRTSLKQWMLKVQVGDYDSKNEFVPQGENNIVFVYVEAGATANFSNHSSSFAQYLYEFRGRLFYPPYWHGKTLHGIKIGTGMNLNSVEDLVSYYRINSSTAEDLLSLSSQFIQYDNSPIIVIRSNAISSGIGSSSTSLSNAFSTSDDVSYEYAQEYDKVMDGIYAVGYESTMTQFTLSNVNDRGIMYASPNDENISFYEIDFNMSAANTDAHKTYEYEVLYLTKGNNFSLQLTKFYSQELFEIGTIDKQTNQISGQVKLKLSASKAFLVEEAAESNGSKKLFNILFPYTKLNGFNFNFTWNNNVWAYRLTKNSILMNAVVSENLSDDFQGNDALISPTRGQILFREEINTKTDVMECVFTNTAFNQGVLKAGTGLVLRLVRTPAQAFPGPSFDAFRLNFGQIKSIERVDVNFYQPSGSDNYTHFICPTYGYVTVGNIRNWDFMNDDANSTAGGAHSTRVQGKLVSPFWYFDAFSSSRAEKLLTSVSEGEVPVIRRIYSNLSSYNLQPYMEMKSLGYTPPPVETLPRIASHIDPRNRKFMIVYNNGQNFNQKYSYTKFTDWNTYPERINVQKSLRISTPVYSPVGINSAIEFNRIGDEYNFSIDKQGYVLAALNVLSFQPTSGQTQSIAALYAQIDGQFVPFGYSNFVGEKTPLLITVGDVSSNSQVYFQVPDVEKISNLQLKPPVGLSKFEDVYSIVGLFIKNYIQGAYPSLVELSCGVYVFLYYLDSKVYGMISSDEGKTWHRPNVDLKNDPQSYSAPIPFLSGYKAPLVIEDSFGQRMHIFLYDDQKFTISMASVSYIAFLSFNKGVGEVILPQGNIVGTSEVNKVRNNSTLSWEHYHSDGKSVGEVVGNSSENFSACMSQDGILYLIYTTLGGKMTMLLSFDAGPNGAAGAQWNELAVDFLDPDSHLAKIITEDNIVAVSLVYDNRSALLYLFISMKENKLFLFKLPEVITKIKNDSQKVVGLQNILNRIKPILVVGLENNDQNADYEKNNFIAEEFPSQIISAQVLSTGEMFVIYNQDGNVKAIVSKDAGSNWFEYSYI